MKTKNKVAKVIKELEENPVREYLELRKGAKLSVDTISVDLKMKRRKVLYYACNSNNIRRIIPHEVGSYKNKVNVFTNC